jgi:hypothetical protein
LAVLLKGHSHEKSLWDYRFKQVKVRQHILITIASRKITIFEISVFTM